MNNNSKKQKNNTGFTLVEALVAISILMIAIASPMALTQKGLSTAVLSKDQMIGSFLAQDAIEAVKNIRDQIARSQTTGDWLDNTLLSDCVCSIAQNNCDFDSPLTLKFCTIDTTSPIWINNSKNSIYGATTFGNNKLKISYTNPDINGVKHFLKYDYIGTNGEDSKFTRYINIRKTSNPNEAAVNVRVFWDSPLGRQNIDVSNFIYNYSENL